MAKKPQNKITRPAHRRVPGGTAVGLSGPVPCGGSSRAADIVAENARRIAALNTSPDPVTGEGCLLERAPLDIPDFTLPHQSVPLSMLDVPLVRLMRKYGSIRAFLRDLLDDLSFQDPVTYEAGARKVREQLIRIRIRYDFEFWCALLVYIKPKGGGDDIRFRLNPPQRTLVDTFERQRLANQPIRVVLLKARQWGGSTVTQVYMAWLQLVHKVGLNSLIVGHQNASSIEVKDMFNRLIQHYPVEMLYPPGDKYDPGEDKIVGVDGSTNIKRVPQRNFKIKIGSAETPNSARGGDYNLVHLTEVGMFRKTEGKTPEEIVQSACSGILNRPYTMIVYESTAKGSGNFFHLEWRAASDGKSTFAPVFVPWYQIPWDTEPVDNPAEFAQWLIDNKDNDTPASDREEPGSYLWHLWQCGASLEGIQWYIIERSKHNSHASMASECPTDDIEAFTFSGRKVFDDEDVERLRPSCRPPRIIGDIYGHDDTGDDALLNLRVRPEQNGRLAVWQDVEHDTPDEYISDRYLVVVDVCKGHSAKADYAVIAVFDRLWMIDGDKPSIVAQWYGHIEMDRLAWKAAQIAEYYNHALLVIESNTLETNNTRGDAEYILNLVRDSYDNLYARKPSNDDVREKRPVKYGFHTNVATKPVIINVLKTAVREGLYTERDAACLEEYKVYVQNEKGAFEAPAGFHDDRLMTRAIGLHICFNEMPLPAVRTRAAKPPTHTPISEATI